MATDPSIYKDKSSWLFKSASSTELKVHVGTFPFTLDKELLASKSAKAAALLKDNPDEGLSCLLHDIPADMEIFQLVARFCHGYEVHMSTDNIIPLICLAFYLGMDENHSTNNLLSKAVTFFEHKVLPSWNQIIKALRVSEKFLQQIMQLGLFEACLQAMIIKALENPKLLGEPIESLGNFGDTEDSDDTYRPNAKRRLFALDWQEDITTFPLQLYEPIIYAMNQHQIPPEYISASIYRYAKKWIFSCNFTGETMSIYKRKSRRNAIETLERLLPQGRELVPCLSLFEMLHSAIDLEACSACRNGFEIRIGKQLDRAKVKDLLILSQGYDAREVQYDVECLRRILKIFYGNYSSSNISGFITVAELLEDFLAEIAGDIHLMKETFISLAEMSSAAALGVQRSSDGIYRAIDIYLDKHTYLTDKEKEEICRVLDFRKMSPEACEHAAKNERLPVRVVVRVLFMAQLQLRDIVFTKELPPPPQQVSDDKLLEKEEEESTVSCREGDEVRIEMEKMSIKVKELEKECNLMKKEITSGQSRPRVSMWTEMKRKFGCMTTMNDFHCQVKKKKKVHPKSGI
ncbi:hypothetical protein CCACVL1_14685 [Corchorus capsularis]|uniref:NPH3 domain-containing protein n=1 Tax=Corchorus capsularis TaxID=210143 RepID=A0A1R3I652_COCAP|nr:hypothetical protein CCACVL1_14685 [Corchorus capsularis]